MKQFLFFLAILFSSIGMQSQVRITEVVSSGGTSDWFELTNYGTAAVDITGWKVDDSSFGLATSFLLNGVTSIAPNERVMFCENASASYATTFRTFWGLASSVQVGTYTGTQIGLSSGGDGVIVFNASGTEVWRVSFGAATAGTSFYWGYNSLGNFDPMYVGASNVGLLSTLGTIQSQVTVNSADAALNVGSPSTSIQPVNPVTGCMDALACNYSSTATTSDNSCTYGLTYYLDQDGDGYGVSTTSIVSCTATAGYVLSNTDCDDNVAAISPGASENCANSIDDNCDGLVNVGCPQAEVSIASASNFIQLNENAGTVTIPVTVTNANSLPINLQFSLSVYSNATEGVDYTWTNTFTIQPATNGVSNHTITLVDDALIENAERIVVKIASTDNGVVNATNNYRIVFIKDNEQENIASSNELNLTLLNSFSNGASGNSAEIVAHDSQSQRLFIANSTAGKIDIVNFSNPSAPVLLSSISMSPYGNINSIAVHNGIVAVAIENVNAQSNGKIVFFDINGVFLNEVPAGAMPDMITFSKDYTKVITANEGEPNLTYTLDPEGSITVVDISGGIANLTSANATQISLTQFNGQEVALRAQGIRIFSTSATVAQDLEPEYVAVSDDNTKAYVTLQENNAILVLNLVTNTIESLLPLGYADYSAGSGNSLDASDASGAILNTSDLPIKGAYMPDAISYSTINGNGYVFMANEGDSREFGSVTDANRISSSTFNSLDATAFPDAAILKNSKFLGKLNALKYSGDTDGDGDYDELHVMGSRSFTIRNAATNALVFDSKDLFEKITANSPLTAAFFNASNTTGAASLKNRSDDKGPEPEGVTVSVVNGIHYAFIALERVGGCMVFNVENPSAPVFVTYVNNRTLNGSGPDLGAEGIIFISAADSPNGQPMVILANEVSSTLSIFGIGCPTLNYYADVDGDSFGAGTAVNACAQPVGYVSNSTDCDDANAAINPAATEVCNSIDDNCDTQIDEGVQNTYYADVDGDGYGNTTGTITTQDYGNGEYIFDTGYVDIVFPSVINGLTSFTVSVENTGAISTNWFYFLNASGNNIASVEFQPSDGGFINVTHTFSTPLDGVASVGVYSWWNPIILHDVTFTYIGVSTQLACTAPAGYVADNTDCDDNNSSASPVGLEICGNGIDEDCSGSDCTIPGCTDANACNYDASATTDDGSCLTGLEYFYDNDGDGYGINDEWNGATLFCTPQDAPWSLTNTDCDDFDNAINPAATEICNGMDDNCNGAADDGLVFEEYFVDADADGYGVPTSNYAISSLAFELLTPDVAPANAGPSCDDCTTQIPIGFTFPFYENTYSNLEISSNGFVSFNLIDESGCCNGEIIPSLDDVNNIIALGWYDLMPVNGEITYFNLSNPNRLVIEYSNAPEFGESGVLSGQIVLFESGEIQLIYSNLSATDPEHFITAGVENANGTLAAAIPGFNSQVNSLSNVAYQFVYTPVLAVLSLNYAISPLAYQLLAPDVSPANAGPSCDDCTTQIPIGFTFPFYENTYSNLEISSNGFVSFNLIDESGCCNGEIIPSLDDVNNIIALGWYDLMPVNGEITYFNLSNPNRLVIEYSNAPEFGESGVLSGQIVLFESGEIQLIYSNLSATDPEHFITAGVENANGTLAAAIPGLNSQMNSLSNLAYQFMYTLVPVTPGISSCSVLAGYALNNTDCDDANAAINPAATEVCNTIDDNCDTQIDEGVQNTYYADADGDGYGDALVSVQACTLPASYVADNTDCDDANAAINPAATEVCNTIDDNCDTQIDEGAPLANAGGAATACGGSYSVYNLLYQNATGSGGTASWSSTGNGWFQYLTGSGPYTDLSPLYHVGSTDLSSGSVTLTLTVTGANGCVATSSFVLTLVAPPVAVIDPSVVNPWDELHVCAGGSYSFSNAVVSPGADIYWSGGDGSFNSNNIQNPIYTPGPQDISNGNVFISLNVMSFDGNTLCDNMVDINLVIDPAPAMPTLACYETASFNPASCVWDVTPTGGITTYFADADGDGFGDASNSLPGYTCLGAQAGYVTDATDCNDNSSAVNPGATEVCNGIDDNCSGVAEEGLTFTNYYADLDGDSFGAGTAVNACSQPVGYVTTNTDCNNNNSTVNAGATESCSTAFDDNCNGQINEGCSTVAGENPSNATSITPSIWPACSPISGTLVGASASTSAQTICLTGEDRWHQFVATSEGVSIVVNSSAADIVIELQTAAGVLVAQENAVSGLGGEILNHNGLTAGQVYKIGVRNYNSALGTGTYSICAKMLKRGGCDYGPGPYTLCQYFKATWAGAAGTSYTFKFTGVSGPAAGNVYTRTQTTDICVLGSVLPTLPYGSTYNVLITNTYSINNAAGVAETISVPALAPCSMSTATQPATALRTTDRCAAGPRFRGAVVASLPWVCGATNWRWEFTELDAESQPVGLSIVVNRGAASNYLSLGTVLQLQYGKTYSVRTAPILSYTGSDYQWGASVCMSIVGTAGMIADGQDASESTLKVEIANEANMSLYPNPTHGTDVNINLSGVTSENVQIRVVDAMGRQVWSNRYSVDGILNTNITFEQPLANGLYFVEAIFDGEVQTQRLMVQK